jgi:hypothetical protein
MRWAPSRRPLVIGGGEITQADLELRYSPISKYCVAPMQIKPPIQDEHKENSGFAIRTTCVRTWDGRESHESPGWVYAAVMAEFGCELTVDFRVEEVIRLSILLPASNPIAIVIAFQATLRSQHLAVIIAISIS